MDTDNHVALITQKYWVRLPDPLPKFQRSTMPSIGKLIAERSRRDPEFKRQVIDALYKLLADAKPNTQHWQRISKAIHALEDMK